MFFLAIYSILLKTIALLKLVNANIQKENIFIRAMRILITAYYWTGQLEILRSKIIRAKRVHAMDV